MLDKASNRSRVFLTLLAFCGFLALAAGSAPSPETGKTEKTTSDFDAWQEKKDREEADIMGQRATDQKVLFSIFNNGRKEIEAAQNEIVETKAEDAWEKNGVPPQKN